MDQGRFIDPSHREQSLSQTTHMPMLDYSTDKSNDRFWGLTLSSWVQIVSVTVLMCAMFRFNLARLWGKTNPINGQDPNWQHSVFVPLIGIYYLYIHREDLLKAAGQAAKRELSIRILSLIGLVVISLLGILLMARGGIDFAVMLIGGLAVGLAIPAIIPTATALGAVLLVEGLVIFTFGIYPGQNDYIKDLGMVITLFGVATLLTGWSVMRVAWFPIVFLVVALPWPELVYAEMASPLQKLAASVAVGTLRVFNVDARNFGTRIEMVGAKGELRMLNVAEACAGLKSVMTFLMVAGTVAFLSSRALWEKLVITLSAIPIAIFCNVMRVSGQGLLDFYVSHEASEGFAHGFVGLIMLIPGFFMILLVGWVMEKLFIEEVDRSKLAKAKAGAGKSKRVIVEVPRRKDPAELMADDTANAEENIAAFPAPIIEKKELPPAVVSTPAVAKIEVAKSSPPIPSPAPAAPGVTPRCGAVVSAALKYEAGGTPAPQSSATPVAPSAAKPAIAKVAAPTSTLKPSIKERPIAEPAAPASSTLKPSTKERTVAEPQVPGPSTLKPSIKPPAQRAASVTAPPAGLKPSTLKPSAKPAIPAASVAPSTLKPSTLKSSASKPVSSAPAAPGTRPPARTPSLAPPPRIPPGSSPQPSGGTD